MRARAVVGILTAGLSVAVASNGCQFLAQINDLEVGTGGAAGSSSGASMCGLDAGSCSSPCPSCSGGVCQAPCGAGMCPTTIMAGGPTAVQCNDTACAGLTFTCAHGTYLCELDCNGMGAARVRR